MAVLPGLGLQPQNKDTGLNTFNNTFISNMGPINSGVGFINVAETPITNTFGSGTAAPRNNNFSDPTYNLTPLQRQRNRNVNNNAENNSGAGDAPPAGNTEKIVYGKILDWDNKATDEILRKPFFNLVNKKLETINVFRFTQFTFNGFISQNRRVVVQVESIKYLSVGDIIYSTLETEISSVTNQKKRFVKIEIKNIIAPNKIEGIYVNLSANGEIPLISFMQTDINIAPFSERHAWDIIKKPSSGSGSGSGGGGGGGGDNGTKIPL